MRAHIIVIVASIVILCLGSSGQVFATSALCGSEIWRDFVSIVSIIVNLQCFDAVGWAAGRASVHPQKVFLITVKLVYR